MIEYLKTIKYLFSSHGRGMTGPKSTISQVKLLKTKSSAGKAKDEKATGSASYKKCKSGRRSI